jgi:hypothetical protein
MILFFEVFVLRSGKGAIKERPVFRVNEEVEVEMIRDDALKSPSDLTTLSSIHLQDKYY